VNIIMVLALVFLALGWVTERSGQVNAVEAWILFLAGVFFWASGLGAVLWGLIDGLYHLTRGS
jgi:hypothetical protein